MRLNPRQGAVVSARLGEHRDHARDGVRQVVVPALGRDRCCRDRLWRSWDWISELWADKFRAAGAEVSFWRSCGRSGDEGERMDRELKAFLNTFEGTLRGILKEAGAKVVR